MTDELSLGATWLGGGTCEFRVWAPNAQRVDVHLLDPSERVESLQQDEDGYYSGTVTGVEPGVRYFFRLNGDTDRPDPVSRFQPEGVHGPSAIVNPASFQWTDDGWFGHRLDDYVIYELHVGTFSEDGTFDGVIPYLDELRDLGITMIEVMPVAQFPGERNWGYDGVSLYAVQNSYGGPDGFRRLVDACHKRGIGVILDVVYNHLGPEGNYLRDFGPYFTDHYNTPWGEALNFDGPESDHVRRFFIENSLHWLHEYHVDAFRLDAVHAILDQSALHFLEELQLTLHEHAQRLGRRIAVIAESDLNDPRLIRSRDIGGYGLDSQWADDFHHALHALLTGEQDGYYVDFGPIDRLVQALRRGYALTGDYSTHRRRRHGTIPGIRDGRRFVVCSQNHDQVGNRATGDRLTTSLNFDQLKIAAGATILSPFIPLLFMGEEYAEPNPFQYFVSHSDPVLVEAVRTGRREEFESFHWQAEVPDPQAESTFEHSKLNYTLKQMTPHREMWSFYRELLRIRREHPALRQLDLEQQDVDAVPGESVLWHLRYDRSGSVCLVVINFSKQEAKVRLLLQETRWRCILNSQDTAWEGNGSSADDIIVEQGTAELTISGESILVYETIST
jgi:maltooligosyltrehalose trehalohydrolase